MADLKYDDSDPLPIDFVYQAVFSDSYTIDIIVAAHFPKAIGVRIAQNRAHDSNSRDKVKKTQKSIDTFIPLF